MCSKCLNPELKLEALAKAIQYTCLKWNDTHSYTTIDELIEKINMIRYDKTIDFNEWQMVENEKSKKGHKISRKVSEGTGRGTTTAQRPSEMSSFTVPNI